MKKYMMQIGCGFCLATLLAILLGCTSPGGVPFGCQAYGGVPDKIKSQIVKGTTTKVWLLQEAGAPDQKIDMGEGKEQFSYIKMVVVPKGNEMTVSLAKAFSKDSSKNGNTEFWIVFDKGGVVVDFGERPTLKTK